MSLAWPEAILASAPLTRRGRSPRAARSWFIRHSVAVSMSTALPALGVVLAPGQALADALARGLAAALDTPGPSAGSRTSSAATDRAPTRFLAVLTPWRKCKNVCRRFIPPRYRPVSLSFIRALRAAVGGSEDSCGQFKLCAAAPDTACGDIASTPYDQYSPWGVVQRQDIRFWS